MKAEVHDLLHVDPEFVTLGCPAESAWVNDALAASPWVVVRRDEAPEDHIAVGVRGATRGDRWGGFIARDDLMEISAADVRASRVFADNGPGAAGPPPATADQAPGVR